MLPQGPLRGSVAVVFLRFARGRLGAAAAQTTGHDCSGCVFLMGGGGGGGKLTGSTVFAEFVTRDAVIEIPIGQIIHNEHVTRHFDSAVAIVGPSLFDLA